VYGWWLDGQAIDITSVPNGEYWLEVVVDPANQLTESNENNNVGRIRIRVNKTTKTVDVLD
jgi:subtilase family serine protease